MGIPQWLWQSPPALVTIAIVLVDLTIRLGALGVVPHNRRPSAALGWLMAVFFVPILGALAFLLLGNSNMGARRREKQQDIGKAAAQLEKERQRKGIGKPPDMPAWIAEAVRLNQVNGGLPMVSGNCIDIIDDYAQSLASMTAAVGEAKSYVHLQFYIVAADHSTDALFTALESAHRRGVRVRVLIDHVGSVGYPGYTQAIGRLDRAGIPWRRMLPVRPWRGEYQRPDLRNHRKIVVVDGQVAFTGSQNVIDASYNKKKNLREHLQWIDVMVRVQGPVVRDLNAVFISDWSCETDEALTNDPGEAVDGVGDGLLCQVLPSGPGLGNENNLRLFNHFFYKAQRRITIVTPYFVPDESMYFALTTAVQRGAEVRLHVGETSDHAFTHHAQRSYYELLLRAGVRIFPYKAHYVLHSKFILIDDEVAVVASSNTDIRSFVLNLEINLMVWDREFVGQLTSLGEKYRSQSHELELESWLQRPLRQKYFDNVCRLTSDLQ